MTKREALLALTVAAWCLTAGCGEKEPEGPPVGTMVDAMLAARQARSQIVPLTHTYGDFSVDHAYRVQDALTARLSDKGHKVAGYKVGYASQASQEAWGITEPAYGPLFESAQVPDGGTVSAADFNAFHIEVEVAFVMAKRVGEPMGSVEALRPYVKGVCTGFDIPEGRFRQAEAKQKVADIIACGVGAHRWAIGPVKDPSEVDVSDVVGTVTWNGEPVYSGPATAVMGGPWKVLLWLANSLHERGRALEADDVVLTGALDKAFTGGEDGAAAGTYVGDCGPLGQVRVEVVEGE